MDENLNEIERQMIILHWRDCHAAGALARRFSVSVRGVERCISAARRVVRRTIIGNCVPQSTGGVIGHTKSFERTSVATIASFVHAIGGGTEVIEAIWRIAVLERSSPVYEITSQLIIPCTEIARVIPPRIEVVGEALAVRLKREPQSVYRLTPRQFEHLVAKLLSDMGWDATVTPATRDGGADVFAYLKTEFGTILCVVEAKRYQRENKVGIAPVRSLYGSFVDARATNAMLVTTSTFSSDARAFAQKHQHQLSLRDYEDLVRWIRRYGVK